MIFILTKKRIVTSLCCLFMLGVCFGGGWLTARNKTVATSAAPQKSGILAIVIDDFGYGGEGTEEMLAVSVPITAAIMPFSPSSAEDCQRVKEAGKEMMIHMPMESLTGKASWVGDKGVFRNMTDEEIKARVREAFDIVTDATALNNHMGSAIMEDKRCLSAVMEVVAEKNGVFLDSMTTPNSVSGEVCANQGVPLLKRKVFLDSTDDKEKVKKNLREAGERALNEGAAIAIGHVGPEGGNITVQAIQEVAPELQAKGVKFVTLSEFAEYTYPILEKGAANGEERE